MGRVESDTRFGVITDYDYRFEHKRDHLLIYSGPFFSTFEAEGYSLPKRDGYVLTTYNGDKVHVRTPGVRDESNYQVVDEAINAVLNSHFKGKGFTV